MSFPLPPKSYAYQLTLALIPSKTALAVREQPFSYHLQLCSKSLLMTFNIRMLVVTGLKVAIYMIRASLHSFNSQQDHYNSRKAMYNIFKLSYYKRDIKVGNSSKQLTGLLPPCVSYVPFGIPSNSFIHL